jgi:hypothetical protein
VTAMKRIAMIGIGLLVGLGVGLPSNAQTQDQSSLGDYARQIRKSSGNTSKPKVFDNDNLPKDDKLSVVGQAPAAGPEASTESKADESANASSGEGKAGSENKAAESKSEEKAAGNSSAEAKSAESNEPKSAQEDEAQKQAAWKQWQDKLRAQKDQIDLLDRELNVLQKEYQLRAAAMYADAGNRLRNQSDWDKQDAQYKQQIADKQKALDEAKQKLDDLEEEARKAGVPASMREP